ncbi:MAG TPA: (d)CMP kinase [Clostridiaceae bacterium]|jgi:cytidylate kinase|nr:(d)CMP kinase [Clostridiaceae bacterium]
MINIAIDGPAGAGKSTIARKIAKRLKIVYLDTGAMYRTVALKAIREGVDTKDREKVSQIVRNIDMNVLFNNSEQYMILDKEDVSKLIRSTEISVGASNISAIPEVRVKMAQIQREFASKNSVVMEGRDIGTYVLPQAQVKIFLTASIEERAKRRYNQFVEKGMKNLSLNEIIDEIQYRDKNDSSRELAPLRKAEDAIEIDTTNLTIEQVTDKIISYIRQAERKNGGIY